MSFDKSNLAKLGKGWEIRHFSEDGSLIQVGLEQRGTESDRFTVFKSLPGRDRGSAPDLQQFTEKFLDGNVSVSSYCEIDMVTLKVRRDSSSRMSYRGGSACFQIKSGTDLEVKNRKAQEMLRLAVLLITDNQGGVVNINAGIAANHLKPFDFKRESVQRKYSSPGHEIPPDLYVVDLILDRSSRRTMQIHGFDRFGRVEDLNALIVV